MIILDCLIVLIHLYALSSQDCIIFQLADLEQGLAEQPEPLPQRCWSPVSEHEEAKKWKKRRRQAVFNGGLIYPLGQVDAP